MKTLADTLALLSFGAVVYMAFVMAWAVEAGV